MVLPPLEAVVAHLRSQRAMVDASQADVARLAKLSLSMIAKVESGTMNPSYESVRKIEAAIKLLAGDDDPRAADLMTRQVIAVGPADSVSEARILMNQYSFSQLPVVSDGDCIGSISDSVILAQVAAGKEIQGILKQRIHDVMGNAYPTLPPHASKRSLRALLQYEAMVVVVEQRAIQGVVTRADLC